MQSGENYEEAAKRECEEEIGISPDLKFAFKDAYPDKRSFTKMLVTC